MRSKLNMGFLMIVFLMWAICTYSLLNMISIGKAFNDLKSDIIPGAIAMNNMRYHAAEIKGWMLCSINRQNDIIDEKTKKERLQDECAVLEKYAKKHLEHERHIGQKEQRQAEIIVNLSKKLISVVAEVVDLINQGKQNNELLEKMQNDFRPVIINLKNILDKHMATHLKELSAAENKIRDEYDNNVRIIIILGFLCTILTMFICFFIDRLFVRFVTENKRKENDLKQAYKNLKNKQAQLVQSSKLASIGELVSGMTHELNQPLMVIRGNIQLIKQSYGKDHLKGDALIDQMEIIEKNTGRMMNIINHLLSFSRKSNSIFLPVDVNKVIENILIVTGEQLILRGIEVKKDLNADLPKVKGDANQLEQVILTLVTNAMDAVETKDEGRGTKDDSIQSWDEYMEKIEIITRLEELPNKQSKNFVEILVRDNGGGISAENIEKIFDPFFTTKEVGKGTGLGLSISYRIIKDHKGEIEVAETGAEGTTFRVKLPI